MIGFSALQARNLTDGLGDVSIITCRRSFGGREEFGPLEQSTEVLFAQPYVNALFGAARGGGFVFDAEALQSDDAEELVADFPDLGLTQFDGGGHANTS